MIRLITGNWYFRHICTSCDTIQVLNPDLSNGTSKLHVSYDVTCETCGHRGSYNGQQIERYHHNGDGDFCEE
jgi:hypothetical protein